GYNRQIFLLSDGEISNVDEVVDLCRSMSTSTRIFSFGLGHSPSRSLIKGLARATNGHSVFIPPGTKVDIYVGEQLQKALRPCFNNVQIKMNLDSTLIDIIPRSVPSVFINNRLIFYGLLKDDKLMSFNHDLSVELYREEFCLCEAKINRIPSVCDDGMIARLAAKALILELQHSKLPSSTKKDMTYPQQTQLKEDDKQTMVTTTEQKIMTQEEIQERIVEISLKHHILSPYTAFVGIEKRVNANNADMVLREVPIQISADNAYLRYLQTMISQMHHDQARSQQEYAKMAESQFHTFDTYESPLRSALNNYIDARTQLDRTSMYNDETRQYFDRTIKHYEQTLVRLDENRCKYQAALDESEYAKHHYREAEYYFHRTQHDMHDVHEHVSRIDTDYRKAQERFEHTRMNYTDAQEQCDRLYKEYRKAQENFNRTRKDYETARKHFDHTPMDNDAGRQQLDHTEKDYEEAQKQINHISKVFDEATDQLKTTEMAHHKAKDQLNSTERDLHKAQEKLSHAKMDCNNAKAKLEDTEMNCNKAQQQLDRILIDYDHTRQYHQQMIRSLVVCCETEDESSRVVAEEEDQKRSQPCDNEMSSAEMLLKKTQKSLKSCVQEMQSAEERRLSAMESLRYKNEMSSSEINYAEALLRHENEKQSTKKPLKMDDKNDQDAQNIVRHIIAQQKFDGHWDVDVELIKQLTGKSLSEFEQLTNMEGLISAIIVVVLETRFSSLSSLWYGVVQKARKRLLNMLDQDNNKLHALLENIRKKL
ncbi:unnamed protein product, partial [Rotaria sp. Silwood1]